MNQSHDEIRAIIREELQNFAAAIAVAAGRVFTPYETGEIEDQALRAVKKVFQFEEVMLPHKWDCALRDENSWDSERQCEKSCNCGGGVK